MNIPTYNKKLLQNYYISNTLGKGGMSVIYLAVRKKDNFKCAIKLMNYESMSDLSIERFKEEIRITKKVDSPYVARLIDSCFDLENKEFWIAMELVDGTILKNVIERSGTLSKEDVVNYAKQITLGIKAIHKAGIFHRDIKDTNIMVTNLNQIKIIDLGIAIDNESQRLTQENKVIGSVHYMPGEIADYKEKGSVKIDIYSIGIVIYQMLIGCVPFSGDSHLKILAKHKEQSLPKIQNLKPTTSHGLINIIHRCLAKNPYDRYNNMNELYNDLSTCLKPERLSENIINFDQKQRKNLFEWLATRTGTIVIISVIVIILILLIITLILLFSF
ncbi:serine/threonine-protein kinase [Mycoplasma sp. 480]|uniref:serine/threonine-protein kinase n=1 Tax=Mycoplasma sp. 480 TaxID=3440155 RepID=UPI003F516964